MPEPSPAPPEPDLTPKQLIERQAEVEERTYYSEEMHLQFLDAGFYRMYVPRRYGGYEFDMPTFMRVTLELARGCPSTAWCLSLASAHALQIGSWFPEEAQEEIFGDGDFAARRSPRRSGPPRGRMTAGSSTARSATPPASRIRRTTWDRR